MLFGFGSTKPLTSEQTIEIETNINQHFDNTITSSQTSHIERELKGVLSLAKSIEALPDGSEVEINTLKQQGLIIKKVNGNIKISN
ncbi:conserved hypothetical protein [Vibrio phage 424E50-1]|nr:conserved hypothetical protein [Vibrio phage 424E50-1]